MNGQALRDEGFRLRGTIDAGEYKSYDRMGSIYLLQEGDKLVEMSEQSHDSERRRRQTEQLVHSIVRKSDSAKGN